MDHFTHQDVLRYSESNEVYRYKYRCLVFNWL